MSLRARFTAGGAAYAAGLVVAATVVVAPPAAGSALPVPAVLGVVAGIAGATLAARVPTGHVASLQGRARPLVAITLPQLVVLGVAYWRLETTAPLVSNTRFVAALAAIGLSIVGFLLGANAAERLHVRRLVADSEVTARLPGRYTWVRQSYGWLMALGVVAYLAVLAALFLALDASWWLFPSQLGMAVLAWSALRNPDLVVTDEGLVHGVSVTPWDSFECYELDGDYLSLRHAGWTKGRYRLPRDAIEDEERAMAALSRYLPDASDTKEAAPNPEEGTPA